MFVSLLENVLAQVLRAAISSQASRFVDNLSRVTFPLMAAGSMEIFDVFLVAQESIEHPWKIPKTYGEMEIFHNI
jgi:hypothetical protein